MSLLTLAQSRYLKEYQTSEMFMTAHRSVRTGLVASAIVSSWTWAATLLQSSTVAYKYAPNAHTFLEIIKVRYGKPAHIVFLFFGLATNSKLMYDLLEAASRERPVKDNEGGSYLTMSSLQGLIFGIINIVGNFGTVFVDNAYWQRAIASKPSSTVHAYLIGGLAWFAIPFTLATTMGLSGVAVFNNSTSTLSESVVSSGLVLPLAASHLLGTAGGFAALVLVFMAVTKVINHSHYSVIGFGIIMGALAVILNYIGIDLELKVLTDDEVNDTYKDVDPAETDPVVEARQSIFRVIKGVFLDITRRGTGSVDEIVEVKHDTVNNEKVTKV
ncbi:13225_t:CDS:2 [Racocetra fulgida]|uniref:13225_t:CDS:1 n=1 Tax=Racocetra fulgida TaxID=60492 RepID=A0A9N8WKZ9_9GLOM|nr:13225_t:CDS:2 [Racocetra fulgida]